MMIFGLQQNSESHFILRHPVNIEVRFNVGVALFCSQIDKRPLSSKAHELLVPISTIQKPQIRMNDRFCAKLKNMILLLAVKIDFLKCIQEGGN